MELENKIIEKLVEHDNQLELISAKLLEHDQKFDRIMDVLEGIAGTCKRLDEDRVFSGSRMNRIEDRLQNQEEDLGKIKFQLKTA